MQRLLFLLTTIFLSFATSSYAQEVKKPVVANLFYPGSSYELAEKVDGFLNQARVEGIAGQIVALISPHAGYEYSGSVAAFGYKSIEEKDYDTIVIIGPSHYFYFDGVSIYNRGAFQTPLGNVEIDSDLATNLIQKNKKFYFYPQAYTREHSVEVQIPFLQRTLKDFKIVPIVMGEPSFENCKILAEALINTIKDGKKNCLVIASTDFSHYHPYAQANSIDRLTLSYLEKLEPELLFENVSKGESELCGVGAVIATLIYAKGLGANRVKVLKYANSGDVTGDKERVVGYGSVVIYREVGEMLNESQKKRLLEIARQSIENYLKTGRQMKFTEDDPVLLKKKGTFVTLNENGHLRGCIGHIVADTPLYQTVAEMAIQAAVGDPRFPAVKLEELDKIDIEISVLSELEKIDDINRIEVGKHGILIRKGFYSGLLLPQVATEYGWNRSEFLEHTSHKAGLPADAYKSGADIYIFSAELFGEK